ncbi:hypothetical protein VB713_06725 [Anabaena cylindrica UHCC 0172]|nr:hypothetical protein [Anabaena cylindrica UHCC 0172]
MFDAQRFAYKIIDSSLGMVDRMPHLPLTLGYHGHSLKVEGLLDISEKQLNYAIRI